MALLVCRLPSHSMLAVSPAPVAIGPLAVAMEPLAPSLKALGKRRLDDAVAVSPESSTPPLAKKPRPQPSQVQQVQKQERRVTRSSLGSAANGSREGSVVESEGTFSSRPPRTTCLAAMKLIMPLFCPSQVLGSLPTSPARRPSCSQPACRPIWHDIRPRIRLCRLPARLPPQQRSKRPSASLQDLKL